VQDSGDPVAVMAGGAMFNQILNPTGQLFITCLIALVPVVLLLALLAMFRLSAWLATLIGSVVTFLIVARIWGMPLGSGIAVHFLGASSQQTSELPPTPARSGVRCG
jgi:L-lactate permease